MTIADKHIGLAREFVMKVVVETKSHSDLMVVMESAILASMPVWQRVYGFSPSACVEMVEMAVHQATERFTTLERPQLEQETPAEFALVVWGSSEDRTSCSSRPRHLLRRML